MRVDLRRLTALAALAAAVVFPGSSDHHPRPSGPASPGPSVDDTLLPKPGGADVADFRAVQQKPAASAAIRRLPHVRLTTLTVAGIPPVPLTAYRNAARALAASDPGCHLPWWLVAGIGLVESGHARSGGSGHAGWNGVAHPPIYGPVLNGSHSFKRIPDTDGGRLDGDPRWDRAVGPMQFLPSTWRTWGPPGHVDGQADPQNIFAAATATAGYLCAGGPDLSQPHAMALAVYSYNHSFNYVRLVLSVGARYAGMSPDRLGVNLLPKDGPGRKHHPGGRHRHRHGRHHGPARGTQRSSSGSPSPTPSPSASPSPSPSPSSRPLPNPLPTLTPPLIS
jgi:hypothetical protein